MEAIRSRANRLGTGPGPATIATFRQIEDYLLRAATSAEETLKDIRDAKGIVRNLLVTETRAIVGAPVHQPSV